MTRNEQLAYKQRWATQTLVHVPTGRVVWPPAWDEWPHGQEWVTMLEHRLGRLTVARAKKPDDYAMRGQLAVASKVRNPVVYVYQEEPTGFLKIGKSQNAHDAKNRKHNTWNCRRVAFVGLLQGDETEAMVHEAIGPWRVNMGGGTEWFHPNPRVLEYLAKRGVDVESRGGEK